MSGVLGTGLAFPVGVDHRGGLALSPGLTDVEQAIQIVLGTAPGERPMRPEFGCAIHDCVFEAVDAATLSRLEVAIREALLRWEPRIDVLGVGFDAERIAEGVLLVEVGYLVRDVNAERNLVHPFYLVPADEQEGVG